MRVLAVWSLFLAVFFGWAASWATTFVMKSENEKILEATRICAVKVLNLRTEREGAVVNTFARVHPIECFKDPTSEDFDIQWPGGSLVTYKDGQKVQLKTNVPGTPQFQPGQNFLLYLWRSDPSQTFTVYSWVQGVEPLEFDSKSKEFVLKRSMMRKPKGSQRDLKATQPQTLKSFGSKVKQVLETQK